MADTEVDFVTIMSPQGIRWTHPDEDADRQALPRQHRRALKGETFTETYTGTLGPRSARSPRSRTTAGGSSAWSAPASQVEKISERVQGQLTALLGVAAGALALGAVGTYVSTPACAATPTA